MCILIIVTGFAKRNHLGLRSDFELGSTFDELPVAFYCASLPFSRNTGLN